MKNSFVISLLLLFTSANLFAVDFYFQGPDGNTLLYTASSATSSTCTVKVQPASLNLTGEVVIPEAVEYNGKKMTVVGISHSSSSPYPFTNTKINCLTIPATCKSFDYVARDCNTLKKIILSEGMTEIPQYAFEFCTQLKEVVIPSTVKRIDDYAFYSSGVEIIDLQDLDYLGSYAFAGCVHLRNVTLRGVAEWGSGGESFRSASMLEEVNLKEIVDIPTRAFYDCLSLKTVKADKGVLTIGISAFHGCYELANLIGFESATKIEEKAFSNCYSLKKINFPNLTRHGDSAFSDCYSLEEAIVSGMPGGGTFCNCYKLRKLDISKCTRTPNFDNCHSLERIQIPEGMTSIGGNYTYQFRNTYSLKYVEFPSTMISFYTATGNVFTGSESYNVYCHAKTPPSGAGVIENKGILHVYKDCVNAYAKDVSWGKFTAIVGDLADYDVTSHDLVDGVEYDMPFSRENHTTTYTRNFKNTNWQAWFVPFDTKIEDYAGELEFAKVNNFFYKDGNKDTPYLNVAKVTSGIVEGSTPYLVRAKQAGEKVIRSVGKLYPAQTEYLTCTSMDTEFTFVGTYSGVSGEEMYENGYYAMTGGQITYASSPNANLAPYRWYVKLADRDGYEVPSFPRTIFISVDGEDTTDILDMYDTQSPISDTQIYNLQGQCVGSSINGLNPGIYVRGGRKFVVK